MWPIIGYGGLTVLAVVTLVLYGLYWPVLLVRIGITTIFLVWFGRKTWQAWQAWQRDRAELLCYLRRNGIMVVAVALATVGIAATPVDAMTCTTHTYWIDGRYVMCQTCCTNGMCNTTCL